MFGWTSVEYCLCCLGHLLCQRNISCASIQQWLRCTAGNVRRGESFCLLLDVEIFGHTYNPAFYDAGELHVLREVRALGAWVLHRTTLTRLTTGSDTMPSVAARL